MEGANFQPGPGGDFSIGPDPEADAHRVRVAVILGTAFSLAMLIGGLRLVVFVHDSLGTTITGVVLSLLGGPLPLIMLRRLLVSARGVVRLYRDRCVNCGYSIKGLTSARCPECGCDPSFLAPAAFHSGKAD